MMHVRNICLQQAGALVIKDVPPNTFVAGVPATVVRTLELDGEN